MNSDSNEIRDLIAKLSDGTLSKKDAVRLNDVLKGDDIAQQMYLDHIIVDGLLEREFSGIAHHSASTAMGVESVGRAELFKQPSSEMGGKSNGRRRFFSRPTVLISAVSALLMLVVLGVWGWTPPVTSETSQSVKLALSNSDLGFGKPQESIVTSDGVWYGDAVQVAGAQSEVAPLEGRHMLRFDDLSDANKSSSVIYQLVDLRLWDKRLAENDVSVKATAHFNAAADDEDESRLFSIKLYAFPDKPVYVAGVDPSGWGRPLVFSGSQFVADVDEGSWQNAVTHLDLTPDARYLLIQLSVIDSDMKSEPEDEPANYFVDKVALRLVTSTNIE